MLLGGGGRKGGSAQAPGTAQAHGGVTRYKHAPRWMPTSRPVFVGVPAHTASNRGAGPRCLTKGLRDTVPKVRAVGVGSPGSMAPSAAVGARAPPAARG